MSQTILEAAEATFEAAEFHEENCRRRYATARSGGRLPARLLLMAASAQAERCRLALEEAETQEAEGDVDGDYERLVDLRGVR